MSTARELSHIHRTYKFPTYINPLVDDQTWGFSLEWLTWFCKDSSLVKPFLKFLQLQIFWSPIKSGLWGKSEICFEFSILSEFSYIVHTSFFFLLRYNNFLSGQDICEASDTWGGLSSDESFYHRHCIYNAAPLSEFSFSVGQRSPCLRGSHSHTQTTDVVSLPCEFFDAQ